MRVPVLISASAMLLGACESTVVGPAGPGPVIEASSFGSDVRPLFETTCGPCHTTQAAGDVDLSTHAATLASVGAQYGEAVVTPGDADGSALVDKIEAAPRFGARMPQGRAALTAQQIAQVRSWIDAGALDN